MLAGGRGQGDENKVGIRLQAPEGDNKDGKKGADKLLKPAAKPVK